MGLMKQMASLQEQMASVQAQFAKLSEDGAMPPSAVTGGGSATDEVSPPSTIVSRGAANEDVPPSSAVVYAREGHTYQAPSNIWRSCAQIVCLEHSNHQMYVN